MGVRSWAQRRHDALVRYHAQASSRPILVGPWRSEIGFEILYWIPWLAALRARYKIPAERLYVISRGGAAGWYGTPHPIDLYDYAPLDRLRQEQVADVQAKASIKQTGLTEWEARLLPVIAHDHGLRQYHVWHPSLMYQSLAPWWEGTMGSVRLHEQLRFERVPVPHPPLTLPLPERFVAVRFYHRSTWSLSAERVEWVGTLVDRIAKRIPVVILDSGEHLDDHIDFPITGPHLHVRDHSRLQNNLEVQAAVLAKAQAFVGTYGGVMQLAVRLGKPSAGFFDKFTGTAYNHKVLTETLAVQQHTPCFIGTADHAQFVMELMVP